MISAEFLSLFLITTFLVVLAPGPAALAVTAESASSGVSRSYFVIFGVASANVIYFVLSATGISALIVGSSVLFNAIKWAGVAYLLYIGLSAILSREGPFRVGEEAASTVPLRRLFLRGFVVEMANPKALLYFAALLPQFVDPAKAMLPQFLLFGFCTLLIDLAVYGGYSLLAHLSSRSGIKPSIVNAINRIAGGFLIYAGLKMASVQR